MEEKKQLVLMLLIIELLISAILLALGLERYFFWLLLSTIVFFIYFYRISSGGLLQIAFTIFFGGMFFSLLDILVAEFFMRTSFVFWLVGLFLAIWETLKDKKANISPP